MHLLWGDGLICTNITISISDRHRVFNYLQGARYHPERDPVQQLKGNFVKGNVNEVVNVFHLINHIEPAYTRLI